MKIGPLLLGKKDGCSERRKANFCFNTSLDGVPNIFSLFQALGQWGGRKRKILWRSGGGTCKHYLKYSTVYLSNVKMLKCGLSRAQFPLFFDSLALVSLTESVKQARYFYLVNFR